MTEDEFERFKKKHPVILVSVILVIGVPMLVFYSIGLGWDTVRLQYRKKKIIQQDRKTFNELIQKNFS